MNVQEKLILCFPIPNLPIVDIIHHLLKHLFSKSVVREISHGNDSKQRNFLKKVSLRFLEK